MSAQWLPTFKEVRQALLLSASGLSVATIARTLEVSPNTLLKQLGPQMARVRALSLGQIAGNYRMMALAGDKDAIEFFLRTQEEFIPAKTPEVAAQQTTNVQVNVLTREDALRNLQRSAAAAKKAVRVLEAEEPDK